MMNSRRELNPNSLTAENAGSMALAKLSESVISTKQHIIGAYLSEISQIFLALPTIFIQMSCQVSDLDPVVHTLTDDAMLPRVVAPTAVSTTTIATGPNVFASRIPTHNARVQFNTNRSVIAQHLGERYCSGIDSRSAQRHSEHDRSDSFISALQCS